MKNARSRWLTVLVVSLLLTFPFHAAAGAFAWQTGRITAIEINAQSADARAGSKVKRDNLCWTYGICAVARSYFAVSRMSPARLGLEIDCTVQFSATTSQITLRNSHGNQVVMRIFRKTESRDCTGR